MTRLLACALLLAACAHPTRSTGDEPARVERRWATMGTYATAAVHAPSAAEAEAVVERVRRTFADVDASMSNWRPDSALSVANRAAHPGPTRIGDPALLLCLEQALGFARSTGGAFDPTVGPLLTLWGIRPGPPRVPDEREIERALGAVGWEHVRLDGDRLRLDRPGMEIDLGGIAKGCALDAARGVLIGAHVDAALVDLGGNLLAMGAPPGASGWAIGIEEPASAEIGQGARGASLGTLLVRDRFVSTSAGTVQPGHLMDPATGRPAATDVLSATVLAETGAASDALSTALYVAGSARAPDLLRAHPGVEALLVLEGGALVGSASLAPSSTLRPPVRWVLPPP